MLEGLLEIVYVYDYLIIFSWGCWWNLGCKWGAVLEFMAMGLDRVEGWFWWVFCLAMTGWNHGLGFLMLSKFVIYELGGWFKNWVDKIFIVFYGTLLDFHKVKSRFNTLVMEAWQFM